MKKNIFLTLLIVLLLGCAEPAQQTQSVIDVTPQGTQTDGSAWSIYDPDPVHLWNRVFRQFYRRTAEKGDEYGSDELDPLLWFDTTYLLEGNSHEQAIQVLDEFLSSRAENLVVDPLKRAMFQRDLWAVFDWLAWQAEPYESQRQMLMRRLAQVMKSVALSKEEIESLPDNYAHAIESKIYPVEFQADSPEAGFLPVAIFQPDSDWVPLGREGGPIAMTHTEAFPFFGRSVFLVFVHSPEGREATLDFIESLNSEPNPVTMVGSEVALVRRMFLVDDQGGIILSPLVETIQIRHFSPVQSFYEFELDRARLFDGIGGGVIPNHDLFMLFMSHGDVFEHAMPESRASIPQICKACHFEDSFVLNSGDTKTIISYSRQPFPLPDKQQPVLSATTLSKEAQTVIEWKRKHLTWKSLEAMWDQVK